AGGGTSGWWGVGGGADAEVCSRAGGGAGVRVSVTLQCHSSSSRRPGRADSWDRSPDREPVTTYPRPLPPPVFTSGTHIVLLLRGSWGLVGRDRRPLPATGCPRSCPRRP